MFLALLAPATSGAPVLDDFRKISMPEVLRDIYIAADSFMEEYYVTKPAAHVSLFLNFLDRGAMLEKYPETEHAIAAFMGVLFAEHKNRTLEWILPPQRPHLSKTVDMLQKALWLAGRDQEPELARHFPRRPDYLDKPAGKLTERKVRDEADIKMMWGGYLASGDLAYSLPVIHGCAEGNEKACAAIKSFSPGHVRIQNDLKARIAAEKDEKKRARLETALPDGNLKLPRMDGDFGAHLVISDYKLALGKRMTAENALMRLPIKSSAQPGESIIFLLVFTGMSLDDDLNADVSFDIKVTDPKGDIVRGTEIKNRPVAPKKFRTNYGLHHHGSFTGINFSKHNIPGVYTVTAELRDNRAGKKVALEGKIKFAK